MENVLFILEFLAGLTLIFAVCWLIGKLLKLDEQYDSMQETKKRIQKKN